MPDNKAREPIGYLIEPEQWAALQRIRTRLYDDRPLNGDQRRDLANALDATLHAVARHGAIYEPDAITAAPRPR